MTRILVLCFAFLVAALSQAQHNWSALETKADTLLSNQFFSKAVSAYTKVIALQKKARYTGPSLVRYKRAVGFFYLQNFTNALSDLDIFIAANPAFSEARLLRAFIYRELGNAEKQLIDINEVLAADPWNTNVLTWRAGLYLDRGEYEQAQTDLLKVKEVHTDEEIELYLGLTWYYLGNPEEALNRFDTALSINGGYTPAYQYAGILCVEQEAYNKALTYIDLALRLEPENYQLIFYKGVALAELNRTDEGCQYLNRAFNAGVDEAAGYLKKFCYKDKD